MKKQKFTVHDMVVVGLMAAIVYAATTIRVEIPTPMGKTMIHMATVACLISGLLFGPLRGGLAGGLAPSSSISLTDGPAPRLLPWSSSSSLGFWRG